MIVYKHKCELHTHTQAKANYMYMKAEVNVFGGFNQNLFGRIFLALDLLEKNLDPLGDYFEVLM